MAEKVSKEQSKSSFKPLKISTDEKKTLLKKDETKN